MLHDCILKLSDESITKVLQNYVQLDVLIILASHHDANVRAAIVKLINVVVNRTSTDQMAKYTKLNYWTHLGNQLSLHPANSSLVEAIMDWVLDLHITIANVNKQLEDGNLKIGKVAIISLIAVLTQASHDPLLLGVTLKFLRIILVSINKYINCTVKEL